MSMMIGEEEIGQLSDAIAYALRHVADAASSLQDRHALTDDS